MIAIFVMGFVFLICEVFHLIRDTMHYRREQELIRRLASKNETEYVNTYEKEKTPKPPSQSQEALKRWKSGVKG